MRPPLVKSFNYVPILEAPHDLQRYQRIIGRQAMANWLLTFDFAQGRYTSCD